MAGFRAAPVILVADGQSLNGAPTAGSDTWPIRVCTDLGLPSPVDVWLLNTSWETLVTNQSARSSAYADAGLTTILTLCGGTSDVPTRTGAQIYADMVTIATTARGWGYNHVVATTIVPYSGITGTPETNRTDANTLILADASTAFDAVADFAGTTGLDNPADTDYFSDGIHFTALAAQLAADTIAPDIAPLI